jgi:endonuclease III
MPLLTLPQVIEQLQAFYGEPDPPDVTDPWELILWENVAYLVDDERRHEAMTVLRERVGISPAEILAAPADRLREATSHGIVPDQNVEKLRRCSEIALHEFDGNLRPILKRPLAQAKKALKRFPGIGDPSAEKILLFCHAFPVLSLESNGLRVLLRLGFGEEKPSYSTTYRLVQAAIKEDVINEYPWLIAAYQLLRRHGQELCRRSKPQCEKCPLRKACPWPAEHAGR